eukprot:Phypoly_transcript_08809.p1 GENE.Phypoly_transcript_08809~~Phypoly_transcript_08809.p1  ORF type:complete len:299 (+),score=34.14 Phypoly_transcript_08809:213-1109(+)
MDEQHVAALQEFREAVKPFITDPYVSDWCDDACCTRYLVARDWDCNQSLKMIKNTISWRLEKKPDQIECPLCPKDPFSHNIRLVGMDTMDRPVIYTCFGQASGRFDVAGNVAHLCRLLEEASVILNKTGAGKWVWIIDFEGFGVYDCSLPMMNQTIQLIDHYPERLGQLILLDSPWLFSGLWKTISPLLAHATKSKITFHSLKDLNTKLRPILGAELVEWLQRETAENRDSTKSKGKKYWEWLDENGNPLAHDARGTASFVTGPHYKLPVRDEFCASLQRERTKVKIAANLSEEEKEQ